jgi:hypothetical protein
VLATFPPNTPPVIELETVEIVVSAVCPKEFFAIIPVVKNSIPINKSDKNFLFMLIL